MMSDTNDSIEQLQQAIQTADAVVIGAGAGLSTSAGFRYDGERFTQYFFDFSAKYQFHDMYRGGFCIYPTLEEHWAYWSRQIFLNRYQNAPKPVYDNLLRLITDQDYFVLTTNVDHCFQKAGFDKQRLFYTQGDYGLWQCSEPCHEATYDNEPVIRQMVKAQGFVVDETDIMILPKGIIPKMTVPTELVPRCPQCGKHMTMNLRCDDTFVEDAGWYQASKHYKEFLSSHQNQAVLYLELGVGYNTPGIIKYPFWRLTAQNPDATYACINAEQLYVPEDIAEQSIYLCGDIGEILKQLK